MAEILLSLTIIGVVAAITLPSLTGNINERTWNTQRKALYARFSQALMLMPALNGYGELKEASSAGASDAVDTVAETFITAGLSKVMKINNICSSGTLKDCGIPDKLTTMTNSQIDFPQDWNELNPKMLDASYANSSVGVALSNELINVQAAAFETANGESIAVYYQPNCAADMQEGSVYMIQPKICANFIYDLNGTKGPNTVGKDIGFITVLYPTDSVVVAPLPHVNAGQRGLSIEEGTQYCTNLDSEYRVPNKDEAAALFVNKDMIGNLPAGWLTTSSKGLENGSLRIWTQSTYTGNRVLTGESASNDNYVRCVKR